MFNFHRQEIQQSIIPTANPKLQLPGHLPLRASAVKLRTRERVRGRVRVDVKDNALVVSLVEVGTNGTRGAVRAVTTDNKVKALGVALGAVLLASGVEGDDLVAEHVVAGGNGGGDCDGRCEVVLDELVRGPGIG